MEQNTLAYILFAFSASIVLASCSGASETLGFGKQVPDEFAVVKQAPLAMPPGFELQPPRAGAPRPQEQTINQKAQQVVFGKNTETPITKNSSAESLFLDQAGANEAMKGIRSQVDQESSEYVAETKSVVDKILKFTDTEPDASVLDAHKELERLKKNKQEGRPLNDGETPTIDG